MFSDLRTQSVLRELLDMHERIQAMQEKRRMLPRERGAFVRKEDFRADSHD